MWRSASSRRSPAISPSCRLSQVSSGMNRRVVCPRSKLKARWACRRRAQRQLVHLAMQRGGFLLQPQVQVGGGELVAQEVLHLGRVLDLPLLVVQFLQRLVPAPLRAEDLELDLLDLDRQHLHLVEPLVASGAASRPRSASSAGGGALDVGDGRA